MLRIIENHEQEEDYAYKVAKYVKRHQLALGIPLTSFGAIYLVFGMLGGWSETSYWYEWQKEIVRHWGFLAFPLFILSLFSLIIGIVLLYIDSKRYHERHPELYTGE
jgi:hypothetical protein